MRTFVAALGCAGMLLLAPTALAVQLDLSKPGENASEPTIATNAIGEAIAVWSRRDETTGFFAIQAASRQTTTTYQPLGNLSDPAEAAQAPQVAVDQAGNAISVWQRNDGTGHTIVQAKSFAPDGRVIAPTVDLSTPPTSGPPGTPPHISGQEPQVAITPAGAGVIVWQEDDFAANIISIRAAAIAPGGAITSLGEISTPGAKGVQDDEDPQVAVDPAGDAIAVWAHFDGANFVIQAALRPAGAANFGTPFNVSVPPPSPEPPQEDALEPHVAVDPAGDAVVVWTKREGQGGDTIIQAGTLPAGAAAFTAPQRLSPTGQQAGSPRVAVDQAGRAVAAWQQFDGSTAAIDTASLPAFGGAWSSPVTQPSSGVGSPSLAGDPAGDVALVWSGVNGASSDVVFTFRPAGGVFGNQLALSAPGQHAVNPQVAVDQAGDPFVVWQRSDGKNTIISTDVPQIPGSGIPVPPGPVGGCVNRPGLPPCQPAPPPAQPPRPLLLRLTPRTFSTAGRLVSGHCVAVTAANRSSRICTRPIALRVSFTLRAAATVTFTVQRTTIGHIASPRCVGGTTKNRHARRCRRLITLPGRTTRIAHVGVNRFLYTRRTLAPGSYRLLVTPSVSGRVGSPVSASFRVVR